MADEHQSLRQTPSSEATMLLVVQQIQSFREEISQWRTGVSRLDDTVNNLSLQLARLEAQNFATKFERQEMKIQTLENWRSEMIGQMKTWKAVTVVLGAISTILTIIVMIRTFR